MAPDASSADRLVSAVAAIRRSWATDLPRYSDLPPAPHGGRSAWGLFGAEDSVGLVNLMTPERIARAARLVVRGASFPLDAPIGAFEPSTSPVRTPPQHTVLHPPESFSFDDLYDNFYTQAGSQWDSLGHVGYDINAYYNGATAQDIIRGDRNTIAHWSWHGIAGRGVLLDMIRSAGTAGYDPGESVAFGVDDLERARRLANVEFEPGDIVLLYTGFAEWYLGKSMEERHQLRRPVSSPGLAHSEDVVEYLWNAHVAAVVADNHAVEVWPVDLAPEYPPLSFLHRILIAQLGMALGELWWLKDLADDCALDGRYACFVASAPFNAPKGVGSPANAVAFK